MEIVTINPMKSLVISYTESFHFIAQYGSRRRSSQTSYAHSIIDLKRVFFLLFYYRKIYISSTTVGANIKNAVIKISF